MVPGLDFGLDLGLTLTGMERLEELGDAAFDVLGDAVFEAPGDPVLDATGDVFLEPDGLFSLLCGLLNPDRLPPNLDGPNFDAPLPAPPNLLDMEPTDLVEGCCHGLRPGVGAGSSEAAAFFCHESINLVLGTPTLPLPARETERVGIPDPSLKDMLN